MIQVQFLSGDMVSIPSTKETLDKLNDPIGNKANLMGLDGDDVFVKTFSICPRAEESIFFAFCQPKCDVVILKWSEECIVACVDELQNRLVNPSMLQVLKQKGISMNKNVRSVPHPYSTECELKQSIDDFEQLTIRVQEMVLEACARSQCDFAIDFVLGHPSKEILLRVENALLRNPHDKAVDYVMTRLTSTGTTRYVPQWIHSNLCRNKNDRVIEFYEQHPEKIVWPMFLMNSNPKATPIIIKWLESTQNISPFRHPFVNELRMYLTENRCAEVVSYVLRKWKPAQSWSCLGIYFWVAECPDLVIEFE